MHYLSFIGVNADNLINLCSMSAAVAIRSLRIGYSRGVYSTSVEMRPFKRSELYALLNITLPNRITLRVTLYEHGVTQRCAMQKSATRALQSCIFDSLFECSYAEKHLIDVTWYATLRKFLSFIFVQMVSAL